MKQRGPREDLKQILSIAETQSSLSLEFKILD